MNFECPVCFEELEVKDGQDKITCEHCKSNFKIDFDYDYKDGRWINNSTLIQMPNNL